MFKIASSSFVVPKTLDPAARQELVDALYKVHCDVFDGVSKDAFQKYVVDSSAEKTWINVHRNHQGEIVGYFAFHVFERELEGKLSAVFRAEAGTLRAYRGGNTNAASGLKLSLPYLLRNPGRPIYYLGSLVHPSSYCVFAKLFDVVWPSIAHPPPPAILSFMDDLANTFGLERVTPGNPLTRQVHWITRDSEAERNYWRHCDKPAARFFIESNPGYADGDGLVTLIRIDRHNLVHMLRAFLGARYDRQKEAFLAVLRRLPIGHQVLRPAEVVRRLKATRLFGSFDEKSLAVLADTAAVESLDAGQYVFRAGDPGDQLFVIARGAVYVLAGRNGNGDGEDSIIDELGTGALFGEIAMLSGERRSASLRTASAVILIEISRQTLFSVLDANPTLRDTLWRHFAERRFDDCIRGLGHFKTLARTERLALIEAGIHQGLGDQEATTVDAGFLLFVLIGELRVDQAGSSMVVRGPTLIEADSRLALTAKGPARIVRIPRPEGLPDRALMATA